MKEVGLVGLLFTLHGQVCVCRLPGNNWHQDSLWEEGTLAEAV